MSQPSPSHSTIRVSLRHHSDSSRFSVSHCVLHDHLILIQIRTHTGSAQHCFQRKIHCNYPTKDPEPRRFDQLQHKLPTINHSTMIINSSTEHAILLWIHPCLHHNRLPIHLYKVSVHLPTRATYAIVECSRVITELGQLSSNIEMHATMGVIQGNLAWLLKRQFCKQSERSMK